MGVCSTSLLQNPGENVRSIGKINLLLTCAIGSIICLLNSKMEAARHKAVERPLFQGSLVELGMVSQSFSGGAYSVQAGFPGRDLPVPHLCSPQLEEEKSGDGKVTLL